MKPNSGFDWKWIISGIFIPIALFFMSLEFYHFHHYPKIRANMYNFFTNSVPTAPKPLIDNILWAIYFLSIMAYVYFRVHQKFFSKKKTNTSHHENNADMKDKNKTEIKTYPHPFIQGFETFDNLNPLEPRPRTKDRN